MNHTKIIAYLPLIVLFLVSSSIAGTTGKISGHILNQDDGTPIAAVNTIVEGTRMGAATDLDGYFSILNVPAGTYTLIISCVGYQEAHYQGVEVKPDLTTRLEIHLKRTVLEAAEEVVIQVEPELLRFDMTNKMSLMEAREIQDFPAVDIQAMLKSQAGFTEDASGEIHVRGGRSQEVLYIVDGMPLKDPMTGRLATLINPEAVQEMVVLSGTFNAEYGDAMSAVVNVITREPTSKFGGQIEYISPYLNPSPYREADWGGAGTDALRNSEGGSLYTVPTVEDIIDPGIPVLGIMSGTLSGPLPMLDDRWGFALSGRYRKEDSYLPFGYDVEHQGLGKLKFQAFAELKLTATTDLSRRQYQDYSHHWRYLSKDYRRNDLKSGYFGVQAVHTPQENLFYTANLYYLRQRGKTAVDSKEPEDYTEGQSTGEFFFANDDNIYRRSGSDTYGCKLDVNLQASKAHLLKFGLDLKQHELADTTYVEPWPGGINSVTKYDRWADEYAAYVQDKIELRYLVVNLGLRLDYINPRAQFWSDPTEPNSGMSDIDSYYQLSPRIGLAHPVSSSTVLHFAYGHFFQKPNFREVYYNSQYWTEPDLMLSLDYPLVGNPRVKPQKTVAYEAGVKQSLGEDLALDVNLWYKDVTDLLATTEVRSYPYHYIIYDNADYASIRGFDLTLHRRFRNNFAANLNYTFSVATGNRSDPTAGYWDAYTQENPPYRETYLDFDRRHDLSFNMDYQIGTREGLRVLGVYPLERTGLNLLLTVASGMPYTPYVGPTVDVEENSGRMEWTTQVDLELRRSLTISPTTVTFLLQVENLFDTQNPLSVWSRTGKPWDDGWEGLFASYDSQRDPSNIGPPRLIRAGFRLEF